MVIIPVRQVYTMPSRDRVALCAYLGLVLLLCFASRSAWSLYSPCGPSGRGFTTTWTSFLFRESLANGGESCRLQSKPLPFNSLINRLASCSLAGSFVGSTYTPTSEKRFIGSPNFAVSWKDIVSDGGWTTAPVSFIADAMSSAKDLASISPALYQKVAPSDCGGNFPSLAASSDSSLAFKCLQETRASIFTLARCSLSACPFAISAAVLSCCVELSSVFAFNSVSAITCLSKLRSSVSAIPMQPSNIPSAATPPITRMNPIMDHSGMRFRSGLGTSHFVLLGLFLHHICHSCFTSGYSKSSPIPTTTVEPTSRWNHFSESASRLFLCAESRTVDDAEVCRMKRSWYIALGIMAIIYLCIVIGWFKK